jgi:hypothetical protein
MATRKPKSKKPELIETESLASMLGMDESVSSQIEEWKPLKLSPFDFMNEISYGKKNIIVDDDTENQYLPFMVNTGLSQSQDTVILANYMNTRPHIPKKAQFLFLMNTVPKRKRFEKWAKLEEVENLELIMEYYGYSRNKALSVLSILSLDQIDFIKTKSFKGGTA